MLPSLMIASGILLGIGSAAFADPPPKKVAKAPRSKGDEKVAVAIIGLLDFDGDGRSDRKQLFKVIAKAGVRIAIEVDARGVRKPDKGKITPQMKYLLVGKLLDPAKVTDPKERKTAQRVLTHFHVLRAEARQAGVQMVSVPELLIYGSYSARRAANPGLYAEWPRKAGSENDAFNPKARRSIFTRSKRLKQQPCSGQ
jgi:hypothetical protein